MCLVPRTAGNMVCGGWAESVSAKSMSARAGRQNVMRISVSHRLWGGRSGHRLRASKSSAVRVTYDWLLMILLDGESLTLAQVGEVARGSARVGIAPAAIESMRRSRT